MRVAGDIVRAAGVVRAQQQFGRVIAVVQKGIANRPITIQTLQIDPGAAGVAQRRGIGVVGETGAVGGDVVGDELAEVGPTSRLPRVVPAARGERRAIAGALPRAEGIQQRLVGIEGREVREEAVVGAAVDRRIDRPHRSQTMIADMG